MHRYGRGDTDVTRVAATAGGNPVVVALPIAVIFFAARLLVRFVLPGIVVSSLLLAWLGRKFLAVAHRATLAAKGFHRSGNALPRRRSAAAHSRSANVNTPVNTRVLPG